LFFFPPKQWKREAYQLPDGVQAYIPQIKPTFQCKDAGYFADVENACKLFHVCVAQQKKVRSQKDNNFKTDN
jgi:hypothetical protein